MDGKKKVIVAKPVVLATPRKRPVSGICTSIRLGCASGDSLEVCGVAQLSVIFRS
jgi:hypothetical protein